MRCGNPRSDPGKRIFGKSARLDATWRDGPVRSARADSAKRRRPWNAQSGSATSRACTCCATAARPVNDDGARGSAAGDFLRERRQKSRQSWDGLAMPGFFVEPERRGKFTGTERYCARSDYVLEREVSLVVQRPNRMID